MKKRNVYKITTVVFAFTSLASAAFIAVNWQKLGLTSEMDRAAEKDAGRSTTAKALAPRRDISLKGAIRAKTSELEACYNNFLAERTEAHSPTQEGSVKLSWMVDTEGVVSSVALTESEFGDASLEACIIDHVKSWTFGPAPESPAMMVAHKFTFKQRSPANAIYE